MTTFGMGMMVAPVLGPTLGGWITVHWSWRWNFYINLPTGAMAAFMVYRFVHDPVYLRKQGGSGKVDYLGIVLIGLALGLFQITLHREIAKKQYRKSTQQGCQRETRSSRRLMTTFDAAKRQRKEEKK